MDSRIHRAALSGRPLCGAEGPVRISSSGAVVTCQACEPPLNAAGRQALRETVERSIADAAARWRSRFESPQQLADRTGRAVSTWCFRPNDCDHESHDDSVRFGTLPPRDQDGSARMVAVYLPR